MKLLSILFLLTFSTALPRLGAEAIRYILDTDIASDCDDAGAVAMVNALADNGEVYAGKEGKKHHSADRAGILHAIRGTGTLFRLVENGHQTCDKDGNTKWIPAPAPGRMHAYLSKLEGKDGEIAEVIETLMTQSPKRAR